MELRHTDAELTLRFEGWERWWALSTGVSIPRGDITSITFHPTYQDPGGVWRSGGTGLPGVLYAGRFRRNGRREIWYLRRPDGGRRPRASNVLEVVTDLPEASRLLLTVDPAEAEAIIGWFRHGDGDTSAGTPDPER